MTLLSFSVNRRNRLQVRAMLPKVNGSSTNETMFSRHSFGKDKMDTAMISDHMSTIIDIMSCNRNLRSSFTLKSVACSAGAFVGAIDRSCDRHFIL